MSSSEPIHIPPSEPEVIAPSQSPTTISYLVTAAIFFALGFLVAGLIGFNLLDKNLTVDPQAVGQAVDATFVALTPTVTPIPPTATAAPVQLTYSGRDHILGVPVTDAPVTLVEFSDYQCPWCGLFAQDTMPTLLAKYEGYVNFVYRDYPIFGEPSVWAAHGAVCAEQQDRFTDYHFALFDTHRQDPPPAFDQALLLQLAQDLSLDTDAFQTCMNDGSVQQEIAQNFIDGQYFLGQAGTPTFLLNGQRIEGAGSPEYFSRLIDEELKKLGIEPPA